MHAPNRTIGHMRSPEGRYARLVDRVTLYGDPLPFGELAERAIPNETRYLVMDLDRTVHKGRNMGELLGFELIGYHAYGMARLKEVEAGRAQSRFNLDTMSIPKLLHYMWLGLVLWAYPGLYYLMWCKLAVRRGWSRRWSFLRFGQEPVTVVQRMPQLALMNQLSDVPLDTLRELSRMVWRRYEADQVISREDIEAIRRRCPGIVILLSSASPRPMLEVAAEELGVDDVIYSSTEEVDGYLSAPLSLSRWVGGGLTPRRISPPSLEHINSSVAKIDALVSRYPDILSASEVTVGVTDTGYGEDHCWAQYFQRVVDVNSSSPFAPIVSVDSPLEEVHSASVLTKGERVARGDAVSTVHSVRRVFSKEQLQALLAPVMVQVESMADAHATRAASMAEALDGFDRRVRLLMADIECAITAYNNSAGALRRDAWAQLRAMLKVRAGVFKRLRREEAPLSLMRFQLTQLLEDSRRLLDEANSSPPRSAAPSGS